jgi:hypothetical protein
MVIGSMGNLGKHVKKLVVLIKKQMIGFGYYM